MILVAVALLAAAAGRGFWGAHGEARRSEVAREMVESGQWLVPTLLGEPFLTKPPLLYWSVAGSMQVFGVNPWAARLPAILATLLALLAVDSLGRSLSRELAPNRSTGGGVPPAIHLAGLPLVLTMGLNAETEPLLLASTAWATALVWRLPPRSSTSGIGRLLPAVLATSLAFLVKGPLGWIFPLLGWIAWETGLPAGRRRLRPVDWAWLFLLQIPLVAPWFLAVLARHPEALSIWLGESVARVADADFQVHREAFWYYLPRLAVFLPALLWLRASSWRGRAARIPLVWLAAGVLVLSLATSKRTHYLLSLAPAAALLPLAADPFRPGEWRERVVRAMAWLPASLFAAALVLLAARGGLPAWRAGTALAMALAALAVAGRPTLDGSLRWALVLSLVLLGSSWSLLPAIDRYRNPRSFYDEVARIVDDHEPLVNWRNDSFAASFHLGRTLPVARTPADLERLLPDGGWLLSPGTEEGRLDLPHEVRLRQVRQDPFRPSRTREWLLIELHSATRTSP